VTFDLAVRLFVLVVFAGTFVVCFVRAAISRDLRARVGNVAFGSVSGVAWWSQVPLLNVPLSLTTWLLAVAGVACGAYLAVLARKGL
jgi:hypothetical protein